MSKVSWSGYVIGVLAALFAGSACGGGGCGGCPGQGGNYTFPAARIQERQLKARLTQAGLDFLKPRLKDLMKTLLGADAQGRVRFTIPPGSLVNLGRVGSFFNTSVAMEDDPNTMTRGDAGWVALDFSSLDVQLIAGTPPKIKLSVRDALVDAEVRLLASFETCLFGACLGGDAACYVRGAVDRGTARQRAMLLDLDIEIGLAVDGNGNLNTSLAFPLIRTRDLSVNIDAAPEADPRCTDEPGDAITGECRTLCGVTDFVGGVVTAIRGFLGGFLDSVLQAALPPLLSGLTQGLSLKVQGELDLAAFAGSLLAGANPLGYLMQPGPDGFVVDGTGGAQGLNIAMKGGLESSPASKCAPELTPLPLFTPGPFPPLSGVDSRGQTYHVGLSIADAFLNAGGVAAYTSGALCLSLGSSQIYELTGGRFNLTSGAIALLVPGLRELAGENAPLLIQVSPTSAPKFKFGTGTGTGATRDSLIQLELKGMHLGFYSLVDDRYARLFEFNADVAVGLTVVVLPDSKLQIAVDRVVIDKLTETYNELFRSTDLQSALGLIVNLATSALLGQGISFDFDISSALPEALRNRIAVRINELTRDGSGQDFLTIALTLVDPSMMRMLRRSVRTQAAIAPGEEAMAVDTRGKGLATGRIAVDVSARGAEGAELESQWSLDGSPWSGFERGARLYIQDPRLLVIGDHQLRVRSRVVDQPYTLDTTPAVVSFVVDPVAPKLRLVRSVDGATVVVDARDERTPRERLAQSWRMDDGAWSAFEPVRDFVASALPQGEILTIRVRDEVGNVSEPVSVRVRATHGRSSGGGETPGCGGTSCATTGPTGDFSVIALAGLALVWFARRRRARGPLVMLALVACAGFFAGCGDSGPGNTCTTDAMCPAGFRCVDKQCTPIPRCDDVANPCCPGQVCSAAGTCVDAIDRCATDGTCEKPGKTCNVASVDGGAVADGICTYKVCTADAQCGNGASCFNGFCRQPTPCSGGCGPTEVCITPTDTCYPAPAQCASVTCAAGQLRVLKDVARQIGAMCNLKTAVCECADIPQIAQGDWGRDSRIAVLSGGKPVVSAYDKTYGDLVCARYDEAGALTKLEYVDGVPAGATPTGRPSGIRGGVTTPGPNVGRYTSIAVDASGNPIIAYYDVDNADLKFAAQTGSGASATWASHTVDALGDVGRYAHMAVSPSGIPHVAYFQKDSGVGNARTALKLARAKNQNPRAATDWDIATVDTATPPAPPAPPCGGTCAAPRVCIRDTAMQTCVMPDAAGSCTPACPSAQACVSAVCREKVPEPPTPLDDLPEGVGLFPSVAFSPSGIVHVVYYDRLNGDLKGARAAASSPMQPADFQKAVIDGTAATFVDGDVGLWPSLGFLADGKMVIAYEDATNDDLVLYVGSDFTGGARELIDRGEAGAPLQLIGADAALAVAPSGQIFVAYQDATFNDLKLARRTAANTWTSEQVLREGAWGFYADLAISGGKLYISSLKLGFDLNAQPANELRVIVRPLP